MKQWYTYIVECADGTLYTGITTDTKRRVEEHNSSPKGAKYTKTRRPVKLMYRESYENRSQASKRECQIKKMHRKEKIALIFSHVHLCPHCKEPTDYSNYKFHLYQGCQL